MTQTQVARAQLTEADLLAMDGYEQLRALADGSLPPAPLVQALGMGDLQVERGKVSISLVVQAAHYNPMGSVHGGVISTLLDTAAACSVQSALAAGESYTSLDLTVKFLRAVTVESGRVTAVGTLVQRGRRTALAEAKLYDEAGKLVAYASSTCMIF